MKRLLVIVGLALVAAGIVIGFALPVHSGDYDCGSALKGKDVAVQELETGMLGGSTESGCDEARSSARTLPVVLLVLGGVALAGAPFVERQRESEPVGR